MYTRVVRQCEVTVVVHAWLTVISRPWYITVAPLESPSTSDALMYSVSPARLFDERSRLVSTAVPDFRALASALAPSTPMSFSKLEMGQGRVEPRPAASALAPTAPMSPDINDAPPRISSWRLC